MPETEESWYDRNKNSLWGALGGTVGFLVLVLVVAYFLRTEKSFPIFEGGKKLPRDFVWKNGLANDTITFPPGTTRQNMYSKIQATLVRDPRVASLLSSAI